MDSPAEKRVNVQKKTHLHADHSIDEKDHGDEQTDIWQSLMGRNQRAQLQKTRSQSVDMLKQSRCVAAPHGPGGT